MANVSKIKLPDNTTVDIKDARVVSDAIVYQGDDMGDAIYTDSGTVVDISDYASKTWVENKSYARAIGTSGEFIKGDGSLDSACYDPYIVGTQTAATNLWTGVAPFASLQAGQAIRYKLPYAGTSTAATLELTLSDGTTTTGAIALRRTGGTDTVTTHYAAGAVLYLTYDGEFWRHDADYDSNTNTVGYDVREYYSGGKNVKRATQRYQLLLPCTDGTLLPVYSGAYTTATTKTLTAEKFNPFGQIYYYGTTTALAEGAEIAAGSLYLQAAYSLVDLRYSFNTGSTLTAGKDIYLVCVPQPDGTAILHTNPIAYALPTTDDGLLYKRLGKAYDTYRIVLELDKPIYCCKGGAIVPYTPADTMTEELTFTKRISPASSHDYFRLKSIKGNTIVWNQLVQNGDFSDGTNGWHGGASASDGIYTINGSTSISANINRTCPLTVAHKYLFSAFVKTSTASSMRFLYSGFGSIHTKAIPANSWTRMLSILKPTAIPSDSIYLYYNCNTDLTTSDTVQVKNFMVIDLTLMFGAGREPATVDEFERLFPLPYYDYNAGTLISFYSTGIETIGRNQWDEEWELGTFGSQGQEAVDNTRIRTKNFISVLPNKQYYIKFGDITSGSSGTVLFYDSAKRYLSGLNKYPSAGTQFTVPDGASYMKYAFYPSYGTTYKNDICISLSDPATNGTYEPYKKATIPLDVSSMTYDNGANDVFPFGIGSAGDVYDELIVDEDGYARRGIRRRAQVDLGMLNWTYSTNYAYFTHNLTVMRGGGAMLCAKYNSIPGISDAAMATAANGTINNGNGTWLKIKDTAYSTAAAFKSAMNGVMLCYELATSETYTLDTPIYVGSDFYKGGIQRVLPENEYDTIYTSSFRGSFEYSSKPKAATLKAIDDAVKIDAELYVERIKNSLGNSIVYLRAKPGVIKETDKLIFVRKVAIRDGKTSSTGSRRRKGWIRPHAHNDVLFKFTKDYSKSNADMEYFKVVPGLDTDQFTMFAVDYPGEGQGIYYYGSFDAMQADIDSYILDYAPRGRSGDKPASLKSKCAMYVERDGKRVSEYLRFGVFPDSRGHYGVRIT